MKNIKTVGIFCTHYPSAVYCKENITKLIRCHFPNVNVMENTVADLVIAIGGDGEMLRAVRETKFNCNSIYVGINCGNRGFLCLLESDSYLYYISQLLRNTEGYPIKKTGIIDAEINYEDGKCVVIQALNEIRVLAVGGKTFYGERWYEGCLLDKIIVTESTFATSTGSTGISLCNGGPIVLSGDHMIASVSQAMNYFPGERYIINPIVLDEMTLRFQTKEQLYLKQIESGDVIHGKPRFLTSRYPISILADNIEIDSKYPEEITSIHMTMHHKIKFMEAHGENASDHIRKRLLVTN